jgi:hypothetical protein
MSRPILVLSLLVSSLCCLAGCGGGGQTAGAQEATGTPRTGPPLDLLGLVPGNAVVVLHTNLTTVRTDPGDYERIASELVSLLAEQMGGNAEMRMLLDRSDEAIGVFLPESGTEQQEGMLIFTGRFSEPDFEQAIAVASARHGSRPAVQTGAEGRKIVELGNATLVQLDTWTWAVCEGPQLRAHLSSVPLRGSRQFTRDLLEFGPRIGLPQGSAQAWASQDLQVGVDMVALVFQGENPQMVQNFVSTVRRHLGL